MSRRPRHALAARLAAAHLLPAERASAADHNVSLETLDTIRLGSSGWRRLEGAALVQRRRPPFASWTASVSAALLVRTRERKYRSACKSKA